MAMEEWGIYEEGWDDSQYHAPGSIPGQLPDEALWQSLNCHCGNSSESNSTARYRMVQLARYKGFWDATLLDPDTWDLGLYNSEQFRTAQRVVGAVSIALALVSFGHAVCTCPWRELLHTVMEKAEHSPRFRSKILEVKIGQLRNLLKTLCYLLLPLTSVCAFDAHYVGLDGGLMVNIAQTFLAILSVWPGIVTARSLDVLVLFSIALLSAATSPFFLLVEDLLLPVLLVGNALFLLLLLAARRSGIVLAVSSLLFALASSLAIVVRGSLILHSMRYFVAIMQAALVLAMALAMPFLEKLQQLWYDRLLELEELSSLFKASQGLLRSCFDVVVELDEKGRLVSEGEELGALLLRERSRQCTKGEEFVAFFESEASREAFKARLEAPTAESSGMAESMQVTMRDTCGNRLRLELMWFAFTHVETRAKRFMLGLREHSDTAFLRPPPPVGPETIMVCAPVPAGKNAFHRGLNCVEVALSDDSSLPEEMSVASASRLAVGLEVGATLRLDGRLIVREVSHSFRTRVGRIRRGKQLASIVRKPADFQRWLGEGLMARTPPRDYSHVVFDMPQGRISASCKILRKEESGGATLLFYGMKMEDEEGGERGRRAHRERGTSPLNSSCSLEEGKRASL